MSGGEFGYGCGTFRSTAGGVGSALPGENALRSCGTPGVVCGVRGEAAPDLPPAREGSRPFRLSFGPRGGPLPEPFGGTFPGGRDDMMKDGVARAEGWEYAARLLTERWVVAATVRSALSNAQARFIWRLDAGSGHCRLANQPGQAPRAATANVTVIHVQWCVGSGIRFGHAWRLPHRDAPRSTQD